MPFGLHPPSVSRCLPCSKGTHAFDQKAYGQRQNPDPLAPIMYVGDQDRNLCCILRSPRSVSLPGYAEQSFSEPESYAIAIRAVELNRNLYGRGWVGVHRAETSGACLIRAHWEQLEPVPAFSA